MAGLFINRRVLALLVLSGPKQRQQHAQENKQRPGLLSPALEAIIHDADAVLYAAALCELSEQAFDTVAVLRTAHSRRVLDAMRRLVD